MSIPNGYGTNLPYGQGGYKGNVVLPNQVIELKMVIEQYKNPLINSASSISHESR